MGNCLEVFCGNNGNQCRCVADTEDGQHFENVVKHELQKVEQKEEGRRLSLEGRRLSLVEKSQCDLRMEQKEEGRRLSIEQGELRKAQRIQEDQKMVQKLEGRKLCKEKDELEEDKVLHHHEEQQFWKQQGQDERRLEREQRNFLKEKDKLKKDMKKFEIEKKEQSEQHKMWMEKEKESQRKDHEKMKRKKENQKLEQEMSEKKLSMKQQRLDEDIKKFTDREEKFLKLEHDNIVHGLVKREKSLKAKERDVQEREEIVSICEAENRLERESLSSQQTKLCKMKGDVSKQCDENRSLLNLLKTKKVLHF